MNDMRVLHEFGAELDPLAAEPPDRVRDRVLTGMREPAPRRWLPPRTRRRAPRLAWRLALSGGLAATIAAGLVISAEGATDRGPAGVHRPEASQPKGGAAPRQVLVANPTQLLEQAALAAERTPAVRPRPDQFVYIHSRNAYGGAPGDREAWLSVDGTRDGAATGVAGRTVTVLPGCADGRQPVLGKTGRPTGESTPCEPLPAYRPDLPTDPAAMRAYLYGEAGRYAPAPGKPSRDERALQAMAELLGGEYYLSPRQVAALFRAAATLPGARLVRDVTDLAGRPGIAVAYDTTHGGPSAVERIEIILDAKTFAYLGQRHVALQPTNGVPAGRAFYDSARLAVAIVDRTGQRP